MIKNYPAFIEHLKRTGRLKLLPQVLRELQVEEGRQKKLAPRKETAKDTPALISGWRTLENGVLTDRSAKRALLDMYQSVTGYT